MASLNVGSATTATKANSANITTTANAVAYYTNTSGQFGSKASANGALYATSANGSLNWGTLPIAQGGTGATSRANARTNLGLGTMATASSSDYIANSLLSGAYDIIYSSAANTPARLPANTTTTKKFLTMTGNGSAGAAPTWGTLVAGDIPSLAASKITSGTLGVARGGTGARTFASGGLLVGNGTSAIGTVTKDSANTANAVVVRDASGNFSAGTITASLVGNVTGSATSATTATTATKLGSSDVGAANKLMYLQGGSPQAGLRIYSGTSAPQSGSGSDGDIYIQYSR